MNSFLPKMYPNNQIPMQLPLLLSSQPSLSTRPGDMRDTVPVTNRPCVTQQMSTEPVILGYQQLHQPHIQTVPQPQWSTPANLQTTSMKMKCATSSADIRYTPYHTPVERVCLIYCAFFSIIK